MAAHALVTGTIFRDPEQRSSKNGNAFVAPTIKVKDADAVQWWKILAFHETAQAELMRLADGDAVSVQGSFKCDFYTPEGREPRVNLRLFADVVTPLRAAPKPKQEKEKDDRPSARKAAPTPEAARGPGIAPRKRAAPHPIPMTRYHFKKKGGASWAPPGI